MQGTSATHGAALGPAEAAAARKNLGWEEPPFVIPADVKAAWDARERGARLEAEWQHAVRGLLATNTLSSRPSSSGA